jgi:uncharacterized membrane protein SpoIIM required for sporulation
MVRSAPVHGFDVNRFVAGHTESWSRLERLLRKVEQASTSVLSVAEARELAKLYRSASSDLIRARSEQANASIVDYLNDIVGRAYAVVHGGRVRSERQILQFFVTGFPRLFREEWRAVVLSAALLAGGALVGAAFVAADPDSLGAMIPEMHQTSTPGERVSRDEGDGKSAAADDQAAFSGWLFTHNIEVSFVVFALGITFGVGTVALLFYNGVPLGALAMQYHQEGLGLFFWAWILPHGIPELTEIAIAGGSGLVIARGLWLPGRRSRRDALIAEARRAAALVLGGMPILVLAGLIEGTISQIHEPTLPYAAKLVFAALIGCGVYYYLLFAGRNRSSDSQEGRRTGRKET